MPIVSDPAPGVPTQAPTPPSSSGLDPHVAAMLAYLAWWVTGILFYLIERDNRFVRFHAAQSIVAFGGISILGAVLMMSSFVLLFVWAAGFQVLMMSANRDAGRATGGPSACSRPQRDIRCRSSATSRNAWPSRRRKVRTKAKEKKAEPCLCLPSLLLSSAFDLLDLLRLDLAVVRER
jgi:uncharacterized membrane protein